MEDIEIDVVVRDLSHLAYFVVRVPNKGDSGADLTVGISIGTHAVSRNVDAGEKANMFVQNGKPRVFCEERYAFSLGLPSLDERMVLINYFCWISEDRNRATNYAVIDIARGWSGS